MGIKPMDNPATFGDSGVMEGVGAVVLCGGASQRMGIAKHSLWFDGQTFLQRVGGLVGQVTHPVVCVGPFGDEALEPIARSAGMEFVTDQIPEMGPLEGIRCGLAALAGQVEFAFVTSCDVPLLKPKLIEQLAIKLLNSQQESLPPDAIVPVCGDRIFGMTAIYRTNLHSHIELSENKSQRKVSNLIHIARTLKVSRESLRAVDPNLDSLMNVNTRQQYFDLLKRAGLHCPPDKQAW